MPYKTIEARREYHRKWVACHPGYGASASRKRRILHPQSAHEEYVRHKESYVSRSKAWQALNPKKAKESKLKANRKLLREKPEYMKNKCQERRARLRGAESENCTAKIALLRLERFCRWCCTRLTVENFSIDHIVPLFKGGNHKPDNLAAACLRCNLSKGTKLIGEWEWEAA